jgi:hypothetical protein
VYHCHLVQHEDAGMMANIVVQPRRTLAEQVWDKVTELARLGLPGLWSDADAIASLTADLDANICRAEPDQPNAGNAVGDQERPTSLATRG